ncbi:hypothetical protein BKA93DRAFT_811491 [Sparassis latifolia]
MVSFQCDGCAEVVKKPKLDKHHASCGASFTCIDCSTTFAGPAQYKSHTQCISEAEKYQKGLYKGPKGQNGRQNSHNGGHANGNTRQNASTTGTYQPWAPNGGAMPGWGRSANRTKATGANGTPLGTPVRMSPFSFAVPETASQPEANDAGKNGTANATSNTPVVTAPAPPEAAKTKKRKSKSEKEAALMDEAQVAAAAVNQAESDQPRRKKAKRDKHREDAANTSAPAEFRTVGDAQLLEEEERKGARKDKKQKKSKEYRSKETSEAVEPASVAPRPLSPAKAPETVDGGERSEENDKKKGKKDKKERKKAKGILESQAAQAAAELYAGDHSVETVESKSKSKSKKGKEPQGAAEEPDDAVKAVEEPQGKTKKRKRDDELSTVNATVAEQPDGKKGKDKSKKRRKSEIDGVGKTDVGAPLGVLAKEEKEEKERRKEKAVTA